MMSMARRFAGVISCFSVLCGQALTAVSASAAADYSSLELVPGTACPTYKGIPIYRATTGEQFKGVVQLCPTEMKDLTTGPDAPLPGEEVFAPVARVQKKAENSFIRAKPNTEYPLLSFEPNSWAADGALRTPGLALADAPMALPFVPTEVYDRGVFHGVQFFTYGKLAFLPSHRADAYPLDENSMVVSIDGYAFVDSDALASLLTKVMPKRYAEVVYYQTNEPNILFRRAFIPEVPSSEIADEWLPLAKANPLTEDANGKLVERGGQILTMMALAALAAKFAETAEGRELIEILKAPVCVDGQC